MLTRKRLGLNIPSGYAAVPPEKGARASRKTALEDCGNDIARGVRARARLAIWSGGKEAVLSGAVSGSEVTPSGRGARV
ncbi:hypothetical protein SS37A_31830 [Methylocystis iwaonis]|uniref:Uncharacterized protein n=1 Tax=Methylocystis iwaonis TaxID=2885079 RepID=A0ABN6VIZ5_9HYPH|nr:hypothetical protein SS37A_31830 [Methylocystis iwaonis]